MSWAGIITGLSLAALTVNVGGHIAAAETVEAQLQGFEEVPPVLTGGTGAFRGVIDEGSLEFELSYSDLKGRVEEAHIHFGQPRVSGGITVFLCSNLRNDPTGAQGCPEAPATVNGVIGPDDVIGPVEQGIEPGAFEALAEAITNGLTYVNVRTDSFPNGEIRGQVVFVAPAARVLEELLQDLDPGPGRL
jgi:hypothetical protein